MLLAWTIIVLLILLTGLYVAAEFAAVSARRSRLRRLAEDGNGLAARILPVLEDPAALDRYIAVSQIGITLSSLILGAYGKATIAPRFEPLLERVGGMDRETAESTAAISVLLFLTAVAVIIGELVPKSLALQYPTNRTGHSAADAVVAADLQLVDLFPQRKRGADLRLLGIPATGHRHVHSPEEIELLIAESRDGGLLEPEEQVRLHRALRLGLRTARQLMVPSERLATVDAATSFDDVLRIVAASPFSRLPVYDGVPEKITGILHTKDVVTAFVGGARVTTTTTLLRPVIRVPGDMPADSGSSPIFASGARIRHLSLPKRGGLKAW